MCCMATMRRPLRSNRAMISPVSERAKASGLTRMRVRSMVSFGQRGVTDPAQTSSGLRGAAARGGPRRAGSRGGGLLAHHFVLFGHLGPATTATRGGAGDLRLAIRADRPGRIQRAAAGDATFLQL